MRILIVEDSLITRNHLEKTLKEEGFDVSTASSGEAALHIIVSMSPEVILLDLYLPGIDGLEVCEKIRNNPKVYGAPHIIMLTGKTEQQDIVDGFTKGADDYVKKPFNIHEVTLRIRAVERKNSAAIEVLQIGDIFINLSAKSVREGGQEIKLSKTEYNLLVFLAKNRGVALSRRNIYERVWEDEFIQGNRIIDVYIRKLKNKLSTFDNHIESLQGRGYILRERS
ncbi:response regulator transcription factor [Fusobacteria bacterium ZRK30]|nr:response regulator transcription factor [Fusobacteria bacterium ZRK30]